MKGCSLLGETHMKQWTMHENLITLRYVVNVFFYT